MRIQMFIVPALAVLFASACGGSPSTTGNTGGNGGNGGSAGAGATGGTAGSAGAAGSAGGTAGMGGSAGGAAGMGGAGGSAGMGGAAGSAGMGGAGGKGGAGGTGGTGGMGSGTPCKWGADVNPCGVGEYCNAPGCGEGKCTLVDVVETGKKGPVCGCDKLTYWNDTIAGSHGMSVATDGECKSGPICGGFGNTPCPGDAACNYELPDKAGCGIADGDGSCWVMPKVCDPGVGIGPMTRACGSLSCTDECNLIKLQTPWYPDKTCPQ